MRGPIYKMPPNRNLLKIEDLNKSVEEIIDLKLKDIFSRLDKIEKKVNYDEFPMTSVEENYPYKNRTSWVKESKQDKEN